MQLVVDKIAKAFGIHEIFKDVSFMVEQGEHIGLVGVNGSGKTTLLRCLLQPEWVDSGAVKFEPGISVGYVQQGFTDIRGTIWQFMQTACPEISSLRQKLAQLEADSGKLQGEKLDSCLEEYGRVLKRYEFIDGYNYENRIKRVLIGLGYTEDWWQHDAATLSGGQKTRLMLAAALVRNPDFMILDEPTAGLDPDGVEKVLNIMNQLNEEGMTLIISSHDIDMISKYADKIFVLYNGEIIESGNKNKIFSDMELLKKAHLRTPITTEILYNLKESGLNVNTEKISVKDTCAEIIKAKQINE